MSMSDIPDVQLERAKKPALVVGLGAAVLLAAMAFSDKDQFFRSYLFGYVFWMAFPLGSLALLMLHHLTGGGWGFVIRRLCEAGTRTFALMAVLFLPLAAGISRLYPWTKAGWAEEAVKHAPFKATWLSQPFFLGRAVIYFVVWIGLGYLLSKWSLEEDETADAGMHNRMEALSAPGLILYGLTATFAVIDWVMSIDPDWMSTMYGLIFVVVHVFTAMAFLILMASRFADHEPLATVATPSRFHDLGTLLFAFTMLWAYLSFSQFLIIWAGNLKSEITWFVHRSMGEWSWLAGLLLLFHFFVPFFILLNRPIKRRKDLMAKVALALIVVSALDVFWIITPSFFPTAALRFTDVLAHLLALAAIGGLWLWAFAKQAQGRPLVPLHDPRMEEVVEHGA
jgi:hypothetical protein